MAQPVTPHSNFEHAYLRDLIVVEILITDLSPLNRRARRHRRKQIWQIAKSIEQYGFLNPILINDDNRVIAGFGRILAAKHLGMKRVPCIRLSGLSEAELRAYAIADNRLAELSGWDDDVLAQELSYIIDLDINLDLTVTGFETPEIDLIIGDAALSVPEQPIPPLNDGPAVSRFGDLWQLNDHRLLCGDSTDQQSYSQLLNAALAAMVFTDPPYNLKVSGLVGKGQKQHREFAMASGEMTNADFTSFLRTVLGHCYQFGQDGSLHYVFMDWRHMQQLLTVGDEIFDALKNIIVWDKSRGGMGSFYRSQHEFIALLKKGDAPHINNIQLGRYGRDRTNVWHYPPARPGGEADLNLHPTSKPVSLVADAIQDASNRGDIVLDPFGGSGTTLLAAEQTGRHGYLMELDPLYVDLAVLRWEQMTGHEAVLQATGQTFKAVKTKRLTELVTEEDCHVGQ